METRFLEQIVLDIEYAIMDIQKSLETINKRITNNDRETELVKDGIKDIMCEINHLMQLNDIPNDQNSVMSAFQVLVLKTAKQAEQLEDTVSKAEYMKLRRELNL